MRIILIGVGGAGCRLVDLFYAQDIRSPVIRCLDGIAVDHDATTLTVSQPFRRPQTVFPAS